MASLRTVGKTATRIFQEGGYTHVQYHATRVVSFDAKEVVLRHGGWLTNTTKTRMNQAIRQFDLKPCIGVYQKNGTWFVSCADGDTQFNQTGVHTVLR